MTTVRLAHAGGTYSLQSSLGPRPGWKRDALPSLLVSFAYLSLWKRMRHQYEIRDWVMDSGAFTAFKAGKCVDLQRFTDVCLEYQESDPTMVEVFGLDVINDWEAGLRNVEEMWRQGVRAIPTYHKGEPEEVLLHLAKTYPKIAVSGTGGRRMHTTEKVRFFSQCFARVWPCKVHGFAVVDMEVLRRLPFHSVDSSSWESGPQRYATWRTRRGVGKQGKVSVRGSKQHLRDEIDWYLDKEGQARVRWRKQLRELDAVTPPAGPLTLGGWDDR